MTFHNIGRGIDQSHWSHFWVTVSPGKTSEIKSLMVSAKACAWSETSKAFLFFCWPFGLNSVNRYHIIVCLFFRRAFFYENNSLLLLSDFWIDKRQMDIIQHLCAQPSVTGPLLPQVGTLCRRDTGPVRTFARARSTHYIYAFLFWKKLF